MKTVQMTLDEELIDKVDRIAKEMNTTRSALTRAALRAAIKDLETKRLEEKHRMGYERHPSTKEEFGLWLDEQAWGDE